MFKRRRCSLLLFYHLIGGVLYEQYYDNRHNMGISFRHPGILYESGFCIGGIRICKSKKYRQYFVQEFHRFCSIIPGIYTFRLGTYVRW